MPQLSTIDDPLFNEREIDEQTEGKLSARKLRNLRTRNRPPEYVKVGRNVFYRKSVIESYLAGEAKEANS